MRRYAAAMRERFDETRAHRTGTPSHAPAANAQRIGSRLEFWSEAGVGTEVELRVQAIIAYEKRGMALDCGCSTREEARMSVPNMIRILAVDDHPLLRKGIAALVNAEPDMKLVAEAANGEEAVEMFRIYRPDVTLMDLQLPGLNGHEATNRIMEEFPGTRIIVLTTYSGDAQVVRALRAGAQAYLLKGHVHRELLEAIRTVHAGRKRIPPDIATQLAEYVTEDELSFREIAVLRLIAAGNSNKQIGDHLCIGEATVKSHVTNILSKLRANDRAHAVTIGLRRGIIAL
jgi:DNA-binding NarL/FixJ family response regulator